MTNLIKDVLAGVIDDTELPDVDQAQAMRAGRDRLKRRRFGIVAGVGAGVLCAAVAVPVAMNAIDSGSAGPAGPNEVRGAGAFVDRKVTYAMGSDIHYGDDVISVAPHKIKTFVQTDDGFAFVSGDDVFITDGSVAERIGKAGAPYGQLLTADDEGSLVAWVDLSAKGEAVYQVYDAATGAVESLTKPHAADGEFEVPSFAAIDGSDVYAWSDAGVLRWDLNDGGATVIKKGVRDDWLLDVEDGLLAFDDSDPDNGNWGDDLVIADSADVTGPRYPSGRAELSPDATYFANDHDDSEQIIARDGGAVVTPDHAGYQFMGLSQWIDDDRFTAVGFVSPEDDKLDLLECSISGGVCETKVSGLEIGNGLALPVGRSVDD